MQCDRCDDEVESELDLFDVELPATTAFRDEINRKQQIKRKICNTCRKGLTAWWYTPKIERSASGSS
jgi:RNase P subunit RPR2